MAVSIAELCHERGMTIAQLAELSSVPEDRAAAIVLGRWTPSPEDRAKVAGVFGVSVDDISWGHRTPIQHIYGHGPA
jgi:transcriptional regulator with XRE-family HTH domain